MNTKVVKKQRNRKLEQRFKSLQKQQQVLGEKPMNRPSNTELQQQLCEEKQKTSELQHITNQLIKIFSR